MKRSVHFFTMPDDTPDDEVREYCERMTEHLRRLGVLLEGDKVVVTTKATYSGSLWQYVPDEVKDDEGLPPRDRALESALTQVFGMARMPDRFSDADIERYIKEQDKMNWDTLSAEAAKHRPDFPTLRPEDVA